MMPNINVDIKLWRGIWRTWRTLPSNLTNITIGFDEVSYDFDFDKWYFIQATILDGILNKMKQGVVISYHQDSIKGIKKYKLKSLGTKTYYDILWTNGLPIICKRRGYFLSNHQDLRILVESSAWIGHTDTFVVFANNIDNNFVTRFVRKQWVEDDRFIAIAPIDDYPSWMVVSNHLDRNYLEELLTNLIPK